MNGPHPPMPTHSPWVFYVHFLRQRLPAAFWAEAERAERVIFVIGLVAAAVAAFSPEIARILSVPRWWSLFVLGLLFVYALAKANYRAYKEVADALDSERQAKRQFEERLAPKIELVFEAGKYPYFQESPVGTGTEEGVHRLYRIGILNRSGTSVHGVKVLVADLSPQGIAFAPIEIREMHDATGELSRAGLDLNPGQTPTRFVDVVAKHTTTPFDALHNQDIELCYAVSDKPRYIPQGTYTITLVAEGRDTPSITARYVIGVDRRLLTFGPA